jgi:hypothetical protein
MRAISVRILDHVRPRTSGRVRTARGIDRCARSGSASSTLAQAVIDASAIR